MSVMTVMSVVSVIVGACSISIIIVKVYYVCDDSYMQGCYYCYDCYECCESYRECICGFAMIIWKLHKFVKVIILNRVMSVMTVMSVVSVIWGACPISIIILKVH